MNEAFKISDGATVHGGDLADAAALAGDAACAEAMGAEDWLDLSTGINPHAYPLPELPGDVWARLPGRAEVRALIEAACACYGAPGPGHVIAAAGSQALIQGLPHLFPQGAVAIVAPTYGGHAPTWAGAGHEVGTVARLEDAPLDAVTVLVNPNNPDGRVIAREALVQALAERRRAGGWLVLDEAFADVVPEAGAGDLAATENVVVLRSFGKFFGLAGVRLGFAVAPLALAERLQAFLGAWAVSGPAIAIATAALGDTEWQERQRAELAAGAARLDTLLTDAGFEVVGGTPLFRLVRSDQAQALFTNLLRHRIYVRRFDYDPHWLRVGLPGTDAGFARLAGALQTLPG